MHHLVRQLLTAASLLAVVLFLGGCTTSPTSTAGTTVAPTLPEFPDYNSLTLTDSTSALQALQTRFDIAAYNLANVDTPGFRALSPIQEAAPFNGSNALGSVRIAGVRLDMVTGAPIRTDRPLDVFIEGNGFIPVTLDDGAVAYTRDGQLTLNASRELITLVGAHQLAASIVIPEPASQIRIDQNGRVLVMIPGQADPEEVGQIQIATFPAPEFLRAVSGTLYTEAPNSGAPTLGEPGTDHFGQLQQGLLEASNVNPQRERLALLHARKSLDFWQPSQARTPHHPLRGRPPPSLKPPVRNPSPSVTRVAYHVPAIVLASSSLFSSLCPVP